jgi:hypothetical protein
MSEKPAPGACRSASFGWQQKLEFDSKDRSVRAASGHHLCIMKPVVRPAMEVTETIDERSRAGA